MVAAVSLVVNLVCGEHVGFVDGHEGGEAGEGNQNRGAAEHKVDEGLQGSVLLQETDLFGPNL